jgi:hypothetical protein
VRLQQGHRRETERQVAWPRLLHVQHAAPERARVSRGLVDADGGGPIVHPQPGGVDGQRALIGGEPDAPGLVLQDARIADVVGDDVPPPIVGLQGQRIDRRPLPVGQGDHAIFGQPQQPPAGPDPEVAPVVFDHLEQLAAAEGDRRSQEPDRPRAQPGDVRPGRHPQPSLPIAVQPPGGVFAAGQRDRDQAVALQPGHAAVGRHPHLPGHVGLDVADRAVGRGSHLLQLPGAEPQQPFAAAQPDLIPVDLDGRNPVRPRRGDLDTAVAPLAQPRESALRTHPHVARVARRHREDLGVGQAVLRRETTFLPGLLPSSWSPAQQSQPRSEPVGAGAVLGDRRQPALVVQAGRTGAGGDHAVRELGDATAARAHPQAAFPVLVQCGDEGVG